MRHDAHPLDPRSIHLIDVRHLATLLPRRHNVDLVEVRREFAYFVATPAGRNHATWQEAWNTWTDATPQRPGTIRHTPARCSECQGRRFSHRSAGRNFARTGSPSVCGDCRGSGTGQPLTLMALHATTP